MTDRRHSAAANQLLLLAAAAAMMFAAQSLMSAQPLAIAAPPRPLTNAPAVDLWALAPAGQPTTSYDLTVRLDTEKHQLRGHGTIVWRNTSGTPQDKLYWHMYLNAFSHDGTVFMRSRRGGHFRGGAMPSTKGSISVTSLRVADSPSNLWPANAHSPDNPDDASDILVMLPQPVAAGASIELRVEWSAQLPSVTHRTGYHDSFHMVAQWFPKLARLEADGHWAHFPFHRLGEFYADFGDYQVGIEVPTTFTVGACGQLTSTAALAGDYTRHHYAASRVHDFAFTAWDGFAARHEEHDGIALTLLYPHGEDDSVDLELAYVRRGLDYYGQRYGRYPYPTLTVVHPPPQAMDAGGMEYPTLITTGGAKLQGALGSRLGIRVLENLTVHELGHQWFYGLLASHEHAWPFLDEGLTTFAQTDAMEHWLPQRSGASALGLAVSGAAVSRMLSLRAAKHDAIAQPVTAFANGSDYANLVYRRTATLFETLARSYGRERLYRALAHYSQRHRFGHPTPEHLLAALEMEYGPQLVEQLRVALFEAGWIDYQLSDLKTTTADDGQHEASVLLRRLGPLQWPVEVLFIDVEGNHQRVRHAGPARHAELHYRGNAKLAAVLLDPDDALLLDDDLSNNALHVSGRQPASRVAVHAAYLLQLLGGWVAP